MSAIAGSNENNLITDFVSLLYISFEQKFFSFFKRMNHAIVVNQVVICEKISVIFKVLLPTKSSKEE